MQLNLFVRDVQSDQIIPVKVVPASDADLKQTASAGWPDELEYTDCAAFSKPCCTENRNQ